MLGPDIDLLSEILLELGEKHQSFGVQTTMYPMMGDALIEMLEDILKEDFTPPLREAWKEIYTEISHDMIAAQKRIL